VRLPAWARVRRTRSVARTVEVTLEVDTSRFVAAMGEASEGIRRSKYQARLRHERSLGQAYVGAKLDELARSCGLDPVQAWRLPRARDQRLAGLTHPDPVARRAAEAAWLASARAHQAQQAAARRSADGD
jgi:hypothetical protein